MGHKTEELKAACMECNIDSGNYLSVGKLDELLQPVRNAAERFPDALENHRLEWNIVSQYLILRESLREFSPGGLNTVMQTLF